MVGDKKNNGGKGDNGSSKPSPSDSSESVEYSDKIYEQDISRLPNDPPDDDSGSDPGNDSD